MIKKTYKFQGSEIFIFIGDTKVTEFQELPKYIKKQFLHTMNTPLV